MDARTVEKINALAKSLKDHGMAVSMDEAYEKAKQMVVGTQEGSGESITATQIEKSMQEEMSDSLPEDIPSVEGEELEKFDSGVEEPIVGEDVSGEKVVGGNVPPVQDSASIRDEELEKLNSEVEEVDEEIESLTEEPSPGELQKEVEELEKLKEDDAIEDYQKELDELHKKEAAASESIDTMKQKLHELREHIAGEREKLEEVKEDLAITEEIKEKLDEGEEKLLGGDSNPNE